jgi:hypothetical protein
MVPSAAAYRSRDKARDRFRLVLSIEENNPCKGVPGITLSMKDVERSRAIKLSEIDSRFVVSDVDELPLAPS